MRGRRVAHTEDVIELVRKLGGVASSWQIAEQLGCSPFTTRRYLDAGVMRGVLIRDEYDEDGEPLLWEDWRYGLHADEPLELEEVAS